MQVNGYHQINTRGSWWYEVLWSEMISLCKKLNIYNIITCNPEPEANGPFGNFAQGWKSLVAFQIVFQIRHIEQQKAA